NQGKSSNERKCSFSLSSNQIPFFEICVTSTSEVPVPSVSDFIFMLLNQPPRSLKVRPAQAIIVRQFDLRFNPKLRLTVGTVNMHMDPRFFTGEEKEAKA